MDTQCTYLSYDQTGAFSKIVIDYLQHDEKLRPFYQYPCNIEGVKQAIEKRKLNDVDRKLLVTELRNQYLQLELSPLQEEYLQQLLLPHTFTICTAHQPNIFTGHLYFIYKIFHAVKLAAALKEQLPKYNFVPVYYMGSEDADLDELGHVIIEGKNYKWQTNQTGAVGRMKVDKGFLQLINDMEGQLTVHTYGKELIQLFRESYKEGNTIEQCTLVLVHELFKAFGLLVLLPDNAFLKKPFNTVVKKELLEQFSHPLVNKAGEKLAEDYKMQASGRDINLFYLLDDKRERIEKIGDVFKVVNTSFHFTREHILQELEDHPERFSANVILRAVFQEMILPNVAFIGGGGELAYWLELKDVFDAVQVPFPVVVLRNSFLLLQNQHLQQANKLGFSINDFFAPTESLLNKLVHKQAHVQLTLDEEKNTLENLYKNISQATSAIDVTLTDHVEALRTKHLKQLVELEKKMLRAEKRKFAAESRQIKKLKEQLFPGGLQERIENFSGYYARYGKAWLNHLYDASLATEQQFCLLQLD